MLPSPEESTSEPLRIGVAGTGALGRHHVRILAGLVGAELVGVYDTDRQVAEAVASQFGARLFPSLSALAGEVEAMVVAVPTVSHAEVGCALLERGLHVMVEKPLAPDLEQADQLLQAAGDRVLAVGHIEFYNPAVQSLLLTEPRCRFIEVQRLSVFTRRSLDIDVVLDLMIHDLQILQALDGSPVREVRAAGIKVLSQRIDMANARVELESGCVANLTASRVSAERVRQLRVFSESHYYSLDYQAQTLRGYRLDPPVASVAEEPPMKRITSVEVEIPQAEPLVRELEAFVGACRGRRTPTVDGVSGRRALACALEVAEAARSGGGLG